ncbi:MAG: tail fiber domain-containing protein, partial [Candidatus Andersenbacteria bacterium]
MTNDLVLQNDETIDNNTDGTILLTATTTQTSGDLTIAGNDLTFGNGETLSNATDGTVAITSPTTSTSGNLTVSGTSGLNLAGTGGDITFANGEKIDNDTDGTIAFTDGTNTLFSIVDAGTTGNATVSGDLTITGDDLFMTTNTSGFILVADGTNYNPVAVSGDITIDSTGATAIGADKVLEADLKAVDAAGDEECLTYETTTGDFEWESCLESGTTLFTLAGTSGVNQMISSNDTLTIAAGTGITTTGAATDTVTVAATLGTSIQDTELDADSLDFTEFEDALDLDADTTIAAGAAEELTYNKTFTNNTSENAFVINLTASDTGGATTAQYGLTIVNLASTEGADSMLYLNNADTDDSVANAILIQSAAGTITNGINFDDTDITNDIVLQNDIVIHGDAGGLGAVNFYTSGGLPLFYIELAGSVGTGTFTGDLIVSGNNLAFGNASYINNDTSGTITLGGDVGIGVTGAAGGALEVEVNSSGQIPLFIDYNFSGAGGADAVSIDSEATITNALQITHAGDGTDGGQSAIAVTAESGAGAAYFYSNVGAGMDDALVEIVQDNTAGDQPALYIDQDGTGAIVLDIDADNTTADVMNISADALTTGIVLDIPDLNALTTGKALNIVSNSSSTSNRTLAQITNDNTLATGATVLSIQQDADQTALFIDHNGSDLPNTGAVTIDSELTGDMALRIDHQGDSGRHAAAIYVIAQSGAGAATFFTNVGSEADSPLLYLESIGAGYDQATLYVLQAGTGDLIHGVNGSAAQMFTVEDSGRIFTNDLTAPGSDPMCWDGTGGSYIGDCTSSIQFKENVSTLSFGLETLMKLRPREFDWNLETNQKHDLGFIAEEVAAVEPLLATYRDGEIRGVKYMNMTSLLTKAVQEQQGQILSLGQLVGADI